jgi:hypothetical protein
MRREHPRTRSGSSSPGSPNPALEAKMNKNKKTIASTKKVELSRETLRRLEHGDYRDVAAGAISHSCTTTCHPPCPQCNT